MIVARLRLAPVVETMFPPRAPFFFACRREGGGGSRRAKPGSAGDGLRSEIGEDR